MFLDLKTMSWWTGGTHTVAQWTSGTHTVARLNACLNAVFTLSAPVQSRPSQPACSPVPITPRRQDCNRDTAHTARREKEERRGT